MSLRIATWNIEWFAGLFDQHNQLLADDAPSRRYRINRVDQADAIAYVLEQVDADVFVIIEAPNTGGTQDTVVALERFAKAYGLRQNQAMIGFANHTQQEIAALFDPDTVDLSHDPWSSAEAPRFDKTFPLDVNVDGQPDVHSFSKPPLELVLDAPLFEQPLRLIGVHAKSKAPHKARDARHAAALAIAARRKQLAQCLWLRARIDDLLAEDHPVMVLGDLNDGPGIDHYEQLFGKSSVEVVLGDAEDPDFQLHDPHASAWLNPRQGWSLASARFYHRDYKRYVNALLDYVMVSRTLRSRHRPEWRIWHPFDDPQIYMDEALRDALLTASDHFPVSVELG